MKKLLLSLAIAASTASSFAANTVVTLTADNQFWLYSGNASGSNLTLRGSGDN